MIFFQTREIIVCKRSACLCIFGQEGGIHKYTGDKYCQSSRRARCPVMNILISPLSWLLSSSIRQCLPPRFSIRMAPPSIFSLIRLHVPCSRLAASTDCVSVSVLSASYAFQCSSHGADPHSYSFGYKIGWYPGFMAGAGDICQMRLHCFPTTVKINHSVLLHRNILLSCTAATLHNYHYRTKFNSI